MVLRSNSVGLPPQRTTITAFCPNTGRTRPILFNIRHRGPKHGHVPSSVLMDRTRHPFWPYASRLFNDNCLSLLFQPLPWEFCVHEIYIEGRGLS
jgi:hypothetical protein